MSKIYKQTRILKSMKRGEIILAVLLLFLISQISNVLADGGYFPHPGYWVMPGQQKAIIFYEDNTETMILTSNFRGNVKDLVWIVPTPTRPTVTKANEEVFENIARLAQPTYPNYGYGLNFVMEAAKGTGTPGVAVIESKKVDYYDVTVLVATNSKDLITWFDQNDYVYPGSYSYVLDSYISKGWTFTAIKVSPEAQGATEVIQDMKEGHPTPIKMTFLSDKIVFPLKISSVEFPKSEKKYGFAKDEPIGATRIDSQGNTWTKTNNNSWTASAGYVGVVWGDLFIDTQKGGINYNDPNEYSINNYIPIQIYVLASDKYQANGNFYVQYGNWVKKKEIEKLGDDDNGKPFLQPKNNKYYLTSLSANLQKSQMDDDLILKKADDNKKVNAGPETWQLFVYGLLIGILLFVVWIFTPLGIMFIAGALILFLSGNRVARVFGWIMQITSLAITIIIALIFFILAAINNSLGHYAVISPLITSLFLVFLMILSIVLEVKYRNR